MKFSIAPQTPLEWLALKAKLVPTPVVFGHFAYMASRCILDAVDLGVLEALGTKRATPADICNTTNLHPKALTDLLDVLATLNIVAKKGEHFTLTAAAKKWLLKDSPASMYWLLIFDRRVCWRWMDHTTEFYKTGEGLKYHDTFTAQDWFYYEKAMYATAALSAKEAARRIPVPKGASMMLDIGGAHGLYSAALCSRHRQLSAEILDLPPAVEASKPLLAEHYKGNNISYTAGNVLTNQLQTGAYDLVIMVNVAHHLTPEQNEMVSRKVFASLRPKGVFCIIEVLRSEGVEQHGNMIAALGNFFFSLSSTSGLWTSAEIQSWLRQAGFCLLKNRTFITLPGLTIVAGSKA